MIRALTLFYNPSSWSLSNILSELSTIITEYINALTGHVKELSLKGYRRITFPITPLKILKTESLSNFAKNIERIVKSNGMDFTASIHITGENVNYVNATEVAKVLLETKITFISYNLMGEPIDNRILDSYIELLKLSIDYGFWSELARVALSLNGPMLTPYYPLSVNTLDDNAISIASLYTDLLINKLSGKGEIKSMLSKHFKHCEELCMRIAKDLRIKYAGFDYSLSPWMEYSVAEVIEGLMDNKRLGDHGTLYTIYYVNRMLREAADNVGVKGVGFCEVMLPIAEDNLLKLRVSEGKLEIKDLISYTMICVAGLDMVYFPKEDLKFVKDIVMDLIALSNVKKRNIGVRLIPTPVKPYEIVEVEEFGKVPVMPLKYK